MTAAHLVDLGRAPIPGSLPAGEDGEGTPAFEAVMAEVGKLSQMGGDPVDWFVVVEQGAVVLRDVSKDLRIAAYLTRGLLEQDGLPGLARGLSILAGMVEAHWDTCWPVKRRPRGRAAAFSWLAEKVAPVLAARFVDNGDGPVLREAQATLAALVAALDGLMEDSAPDLGDLTAALAAKLREAEVAGDGAAPDAVPASRPASGARASAASAPKAEPAAPVLPSLPTLDPSSERVVKQVFTEAATALRPNDLGNPVFYHMVRYATWRGITEAPPAQAEGRTQLAPVPGDRVAQYEKMLAAGHHADLLSGVEVSVARNPFWLTGQRLSDAALGALGHIAARAALRYEVRTFVGRIPALLELKFSDGSPFADAATRDWITQQVMAPEPASTAQAVAAAPAGGDWRDMLDTVTAEAAPGDLLDLLARLDRALTNERDPRRRFLWGMALARACLDGGQKALARAQLERLNDQFSALGLDAWEPSLGADLTAALAESLSSPQT